MPVIWCWAAVLTMSNSLVVSTDNNLRQLVIRPAKVWQALDLLHPVAPSGGFLPTSWRHGGVPQFGLVDFDVPTLDLLPAPAAGRSMDAGAANQPDQPEEITKVEDTALPLASAEVLAQSRSEGYAQGLRDSRVQMQAEMERSLQSGLSQDRALIAAMNDALAKLNQSPSAFFEPIKRLSLHLAEQLVLAELSLDGRAIERLVQRCVDELALNEASMVQVELHPDDLAAWQHLRQRSGLSESAGPNVRANEALQPGSVRASANDAVVNDLIEQRLTALARGLQIDEPAWRARSAIVGDRAGKPSSALPDPPSRYAAKAQAPVAALGQQLADIDTVEAIETFISGDSSDV